MATARDIIKGSLRLIGALATGETPSADEQADALYALNDLLGSWSLEGLLVFTQTRQTFPLTAGQGAYTMGTGGNFDTLRPNEIEGAAILLPGNPAFETPVDVITSDEWRDITTKALQSAIPQKLYSDRNFPLTTLNFWPVPSVSQTVVLYSWSPFATIANVSASIVFPTGYARAIRYNLAMELAPEYGKAVTPEVAQVAAESKEDIKRLNIEPQYMESDAIFLSTGRSSFNYLTGE
jgi:hypothetical protein